MLWFPINCLSFQHAEWCYKLAYLHHIYNFKTKPNQFEFKICGIPENVDPGPCANARPYKKDPGPYNRVYTDFFWYFSILKVTRFFLDFYPENIYLFPDHSPQKTHYFGIGNMTNYIKLKQERVNKFLCCAQNNKKRFLHENKKSFATYLAIWKTIWKFATYK